MESFQEQLLVIIFVYICVLIIASYYSYKKIPENWKEEGSKKLGYYIVGVLMQLLLTSSLLWGKYSRSGIWVLSISVLIGILGLMYIYEELDSLFVMAGLNFVTISLSIVFMFMYRFLFVRMEEKRKIAYCGGLENTKLSAMGNSDFDNQPIM